MEEASSEHSHDIVFKIHIFMKLVNILETEKTYSLITSVSIRLFPALGDDIFADDVSKTFPNPQTRRFPFFQSFQFQHTHDTTPNTHLFPKK